MKRILIPVDGSDAALRAVRVMVQAVIERTERPDVHSHCSAANSFRQCHPFLLKMRSKATIRRKAKKRLYLLGVERRGY